MATKRAKELPSGVDRWTSNGRGVKLTGKPTSEQKARVDEVNREMAASRKSAKKPTKKR